MDFQAYFEEWSRRPGDTATGRLLAGGWLHGMPPESPVKAGA